MDVAFDRASWEFAVRYHCRSDVGLRRATNQDAHLEVVATKGREWMRWGHLFVVADGMGAHAAGEVASLLAVSTIAKSYRHGRGSVVVSLQAAITDAHHELRRRSSTNEAYRDMGTTVSALLLLPRGAAIAHVGDSRIYRLRDDRLEQLTFDHSLVWEICQARGIPFDRPPHHLPRNQITRSVGPSEPIIIDEEGLFPVRNGDRFVLCSDGLSGLVDDRCIAHVVSLFPPEIATETLVNLANVAGGHDNITVTVIEARPLTDAERREAFRREPFRFRSWMLLPVLGIVAMFAGVMVELVPLTLGSLLFTVLSLLGGLWATFGGGFDFALGATPRGRAPYTATPRDNGREEAERLANVFSELRDAAIQQSLKQSHGRINTQESDSHAVNATAARTQSQHREAIYHTCLAINAMMKLLKHQKA